MTDQLQTDASDAAGLLQAYVDGELSIEESTLVARFLEESPSARAIVRQQNEVRVRLASLPKSTAPAGLRARVLTALDEVDAGTSASDSQHAMPLAVGSDLGGGRDADGSPHGRRGTGARAAGPVLRVIMGGFGRGLLMVAPAVLAAGLLFQAARSDRGAQSDDTIAKSSAAATGTGSTGSAPEGARRGVPRVPQLDGLGKGSVRIHGGEGRPSVTISGEGITLVSNHAPEVTSAIVQYLDSQDGRMLVDVQSPADRVTLTGQALDLGDGITLMVRVDGGMLIGEFAHDGIVHSLRTRAVATTQEHEAALASLAKLAAALGGVAAAQDSDDADEP